MYHFKVYDNDGDEVQVIEIDLMDCNDDFWCYRVWLPPEKNQD